LLLAAVSSASSQTVTFNCTFSVNFYDEYICRLTEIEATNPNLQYAFTGNHLPNRTNADVDVVQIRSSNTPFVIQQMFTSFPNMVELDIQGSNLQSINISDNVQLEWLTLSYNNISRINNGTFRNQRSLRFFTAIEAGIFTLEEDAFVGLESLVYLSLIDNNVSEILPRTFNPLVNLERIFFDRNKLTRLGDIFSMNKNITVLRFEDNQINEISPTLLHNIQNFYFMNLFGNRCISRYFFLDDEFEWILMNNLLGPCFVNFNGGVPEPRRITLEFNGPLALFDEFGNIIARVN
jgi:Leucine rich repeat